TDIPELDDENVLQSSLVSGVSYLVKNPTRYASRYWQSSQYTAIVWCAARSQVNCFTRSNPFAPILSRSAPSSSTWTMASASASGSSGFTGPHTPDRLPHPAPYPFFSTKA